MPTVGLLINETKPAALDAARRLTAWLSAKGVEVRTRAIVADGIGLPGCTATEDTEIASTDFVVVFGGDGTLLAAARLVAPFGTPLLGIHLGHFGFITEAAPEALLSAVQAALSGRATVEERMMLTVSVRRKDPSSASDPCTQPDSLFGMNDVVVASTAVRILYVTTRIGKDILATYAADGVIVSSPTGSTGYSLSAGGPLIHPAAPCLVITPISPHTLNARSIVIPDSETVSLTLEAHNNPQGDGAVVTVDGQIETPLHPGDTVTIHRAPYNVRILSVGGPNFYQKIRSRWHYGERHGADRAP